MDSARAVDLRPERSLLDPKFEGYKLDLDPLPTYKLSLPKGPDHVKLRDDQYSFQHVKAFGSTNHLLLDPWNQNTVYYVCHDWNIMKTTVEMDSNLEKPTSVFQIPNATELKLTPHQNVTVEFPAEEWVVICDGTGRISLIKTGKRDGSSEWKLCYSGKPLESEMEAILLDATLYQVKEAYQCDLILLHVREKAKEDDSKASHFETVLDWITLSSANASDWSVECTRQLTGPSVPDLVTLQPQGKGVSISSAKPFVLKSDSLKPVVEEEVKDEEDVKEPAYTWYQSLEDLNIDFTLPEGVGKTDIVYELKADYMRLSLLGGDNLLSGKLHAVIDRSSSTWTIEGRRLEVYLAKQTEEMWPSVVVGDDRGEYVVEPEEAARIHERLAHLTSDSVNSRPLGAVGEPGLNTEGLEECDAFPDDSSVMIYMDAEMNKITHKTFLGIHQWLFNIHRTPGSPKAICLRHDVDGLLWQPKIDVTENENPWEHLATFNALGFVTASKMEKKFASCAPNGSYAIICDFFRHFYIYRHTVPISSPLRNRKTGEQVNAVAKQQVVSLDCMDAIVGMQATNDRVFVLTDKTLFVVKVNVQEIL
ncbi:nudC domain-containing protein 1-like [Lineus longissimus]|uniref:nudC domain-containing protein 1-like n=1 Tax=Lineus longissimus TaxID=88925 RepID=UPI00315D1497